MSTNGQTESGPRGRPRELYDFVRGGQHWRYTSNSADVSVQQGNFVSTDISRGSIEFTPDLNRDAMQITINKDEAVPLLFRNGSPAEVVSVTIYRVNETFTDDGVGSFPDAANVIWSGRILSVRWAGVVAELNCEPSSTSLKRVGLRRLWQRPCPHVLYDSKTCKVSKTALTLNSIVNSIDGSTITVSTTGGHPDKWFAGGLLEWNNIETGSLEARMIRDQVGNVVSLSYNIPSLSVGQLVVLTAGCNHTTDDCTDKFNNIENYGGCPYIPEIHPFGTTIY